MLTSSVPLLHKPTGETYENMPRVVSHILTFSRNITLNVKCVPLCVFVCVCTFVKICYVTKARIATDVFCFEHLNLSAVFEQSKKALTNDLTQVSI